MSTDAVETSAELGQRIREARLAAGYTQSQLAKMLEFERSALVKVEAGERKVSALELIRVSTALGLPLAHFVHRSPAAIVSQRAALVDEAQPQEATRYQVDALLEAHLRDAEQLWSYGLLAPIRDVPESSVASHDEARLLAGRVRSFVGLPRGPLPSLTAVAEKVGLFFRVVDLDVDGSSLSPERGFAVAVVGGQRPSGRRRFTAAHEIGHHVLGDEYQTDIGVAASRTDRERLVDSFAGELLLPAAEVTQRWTADDDPWPQLVRIAAEYRTSWSVAVKAAERLRLIERSTHKLLARTPRYGDFLELCGAAPAEDLTPGSLGPRWTKAVLAAYRDSLISRLRAIELLQGGIAEDELPTKDDDLP